MVHVDDINGRRVITAQNSLKGACSVGHVRLSAMIIKRVEKAENVWRAMETAPHVTLHQTYDWARAWATLPGLKTLVVLVSLDGRPAVLLPLEIVRKFGVRVARLIGSPHSNHNAPLYSDRFLAEADAGMMDELLETLSALNIPADVLALDKLRPMAGQREEPLLALADREQQFLLLVKAQRPGCYAEGVAHFTDRHHLVVRHRRKPRKGFRRKSWISRTHT